MMLTGRQVREARELLKLHAWQVARAAGMSTSMVLLAEVWDDRSSISPSKGDAIRKALEAAGVEFVEENGDRQGVRLRNSEA